jgi:hypothetical protein
MEVARAELERRSGHDETSAALDAAVALAAGGWPTAEAFETLGAGWTGEQALAMGVCAALVAERVASEGQRGAVVDVVRRGLLLAVNHSGDSDSTGGLCGGLLGARYGTAGLPGRWVAGLEVRDEAVLLAADAALEFGIDPPTAPDGWGAPPPGWPPRYPASRHRSVPRNC